jgi:hypothetical protein
MHDVRALLGSQTILGVLGRDLSVRLLEISRAGCLLESGCDVAVGTLAALSVNVDGQEYADQIRIARCQRIAGAGDTHRLGAEFLSLHRPGDRSLRRYAAELAAQKATIGGPLRLDPQWPGEN